MLLDMDSKSSLSIFADTRSCSEALALPLSVEDQAAQSMPDVSPTKWHLAHTTWFWETFLLKPHASGYREFDSTFNYLFNSYYDGVGDRHPRPERGLLTRPSHAEMMAYRAHVDAAMGELLQDESSIGPLKSLIELGIAHEQQHQELLLTDIKHVLSRHAFAPAAYTAPEASAESPPLRWLAFDGGLDAFGHDGSGFAFDSEGPRHKAWLEPFALASRPATNGEYEAFIEDGGYRRPEFWLSDGWAMLQDEGWTAPLYWRERDGERSEFTLHGEVPLDRAAPVAHLSYYEASAFAEWAGARLPEEREWEAACRRAAGAEGRFASPGVSAHPAGLPDAEGLSQMFGGVWEWTRSAYSPYPRFRPAAGAVGEYNGKFMCGQYVLRGGSCATPPGHVRLTYRNFFPPAARWQFSGVRLARDV